MDPSSCNVPIRVGTIHEITKGYGTKAIVIFELGGKTQRAALRSRNLVHDGSLLPEDSLLEKCVSVGSEIYMRAYPLVDPQLRDM